MPIESFFFPKEALQGKDVPSHITWSDLRFDCIKVVHPKTFAPKEIYNVSDKDVIIKEGLILINKVEVDGYLGIVFSAEILSVRDSTDRIEYSFILEDNVIERLGSSIHLFRPDVVVRDVPLEIHVDPDSGEISSKILIRNLGEGTAIVDIETTGESEVQKNRPQFVETFLREFIEGVKSGITQLKKDFEEYSALLNELEMYLIHPVKFNEQSLKVFEKFDDEFTSAFEENEEFAEAVLEMLAEIFLRNSEFLNLYQFILDYINSIGKEKMLVRDPFNVIKLSEKPAILRVRINCIDLLKQVCTPIDLPSISVLGKQEGEIALFKLFRWGKQKR